MKRVNWYITYNEPPNGLYESQVVEVTSFVSRELHKEVRLVAFVSLRHFREWRRMIMSIAPTALVLPCLPGFIAYKFHYLLLLPFLLREVPAKVVCRGSFAALLAVGLRPFAKCRVVLDARGLLFEEDREYNIFPPGISRTIRQVEIDSLCKADEVTAITNEMYDYWQREYGISISNPVVIPCTVSDKLLNDLDASILAGYRARMGYSPADIVLVYSGSTAPWQSLDQLTDWLERVMVKQENTKALFLSKSTTEIEKLIQTFPGRVKNLFVEHHEVPYYLACADYGLLLRSATITNSVASPIKTAEYLLAGLGIIVNRNVAVHRLVLSEGLGIVIDDFDVPAVSLEKPTAAKRDYYKFSGHKHFSKQTLDIRRKYEALYI